MYGEDEEADEDDGNRNLPFLGIIAGLIVATAFLAIIAGLASSLVSDGTEDNPRSIQVEPEQERSYEMMERSDRSNQTTDRDDVRMEEREDRNTYINDSSRSDRPDTMAESPRNASSQFENEERLKQLLRGGSPEPGQENNYHDKRDDYYDKEYADKKKYKDSGH